MLIRFRLAVIEFHLLHFDVVHAHANNCCGTVDLAGRDIPQVIELTFLRKADNPEPHHWPPPLLLGPPWSGA